MKEKLEAIISAIEKNSKEYIERPQIRDGVSYNYGSQIGFISGQEALLPFLKELLAESTTNNN